MTPAVYDLRRGVQYRLIPGSNGGNRADDAPGNCTQEFWRNRCGGLDHMRLHSPPPPPRKKKAPAPFWQRGVSPPPIPFFFLPAEYLQAPPPPVGGGPFPIK